MQGMNADPSHYLTALQGFEGRLRGLVGTLAGELAGQTRPNAAKIDVLCAQIDLLTREYLQFLPEMNRDRVGQETAAGSTEGVIDLRRQWGETTARLNHFRLEINTWPTVRSLVQEQRKPKRQPLYQPEVKLPKTTFAQLGASDDVFHWLHAILNPADQSDDARDHNCFPDIALSNFEFHQHMHAAYRLCLAQDRAEPVRFLDVGCGGGLKVLSALRYFPKAEGFDFDPAYVAAGQRLMQMSPDLDCTIFQQDALTFDRYQEYDVIYFYRPISDEPLLIEMERRIAEHARPGTVLIAPYVSFPDRHEDLACGHIDGAIYTVGITGKAARRLKIKAERVGQFIVRPDTTALQTVWSPVLEASRANGYDIPARYQKPSY
ncbi:MAG: class I SAM-dependent methyltransferase [Sulfitobacter sp.]|nr:class I SAM-dependent methyltransferase [Sulfitobacter sp.]